MRQFTSFEITWRMRRHDLLLFKRSFFNFEIQTTFFSIYESSLTTLFSMMKYFQAGTSSS